MTTELEQEILRVLEASQYGLSVYAKPGADNISRAEIMDSMPTAIGPAGELAAEEVTRTMDLSREEQEAEMRAQIPGIKGMATGAAVATATTIPDIVGLGYGGMKALLAKEGEKGQAFLDGLSSISGAVGSEKAGQIYAEYVGGLDATDEEKAAMMTGYQAGEFGGIPGLAGAYQLVKKGAKAAPDFIESAGEAAKARMAGGTTLSSGVNPDAAIAAAGDAVAKFRAVKPALSDIEQNVRAKFPDVDLDFYGDKDKGYTLSKIIVPKNSRKQGVGKAVMSELTQAADNEGAVIKLTPSKDFGATSTARLKKFYKQFGFVENKGRYKDFSIKETMYRLPVEKEFNASIKPPTDDKPGIVAFHGSGADFDEFKLEKIGTGEGAQAYGYGLYFTDSEDIARYYRNAVTGMDRFNQPDLDTQAGGFTQELGFDTVGGTHSLSSADPEYDYYIGELDKFAVNKSENLSQNSKTWEFADGSELTLQTEGVMTFDGKPLDSVYTRDVEDRFGVDIKRIAEEARKMGIRDDVGTLEDDIGMIFSNLSQGLFNKKDAKTAVESLAGPSGPGAPSRYETIYSHFIEPKIDMTRVDYLMNAGQKKGKMYKVGLEPKPEDMLDYDKSLREQPKFEKVLSPIYDEYGVAKTADIGTLFEGIKSQRGIMPKDLSKKLSDAGIPGIKYRAAGSRAASVDSASAEYNYVIFDDKMIKILEKYGIVGPVAITGVAASQQEGESDGQSS